MRHPEYLSPTSISVWEKDPTDYYMRYLSDSPLPREPQTLPMAVGSSFDAYVKSFLFKHLIGNSDPRFELDSIFESQVEPQNRDHVRKIGAELFETYRRLGALDALMLILGKSIGPPRFEMDVRGEINDGRNGTIRTVPFRVKPDLYFVNEHGARVIFDWKVNGYYSNSGVSPAKGYVRAREDGKLPTGHAEAKIKEHLGLFVNIAKSMEQVDESWGRQLSIGAWLCGEEIGGDFVAMVHQLACRNKKVKIAEHATFISKEFQENLYTLAETIWTTINSDHIFRHLSKEESIERCALLDQRRDGLAEDDGGIIAPVFGG